MPEFRWERIGAHMAEDLGSCYVVVDGKVGKNVRIELIQYPKFNQQRCREELVFEYPNGTVVAFSQHLLPDGMTTLSYPEVTEEGRNRPWEMVGLITKPERGMKGQTDAEVEEVILRGHNPTLYEKLKSFRERFEKTTADSRVHTAPAATREEAEALWQRDAAYARWLQEKNKIKADSSHATAMFDFLEEKRKSFFASVETWDRKKDPLPLPASAQSQAAKTRSKEAGGQDEEGGGGGGGGGGGDSKSAKRPRESAQMQEWDQLSISQRAGLLSFCEIASIPGLKTGAKKKAKS